MKKRAFFRHYHFGEKPKAETKILELMGGGGRALEVGGLWRWGTLGGGALGGGGLRRWEGRRGVEEG